MPKEPNIPNANDKSAIRAFNKKRLHNRSIDELLGICKGTIADGQVNQAEAEFIKNWIKTHEEVLEEFPANILIVRLCDYLEDGVLNSDEAQELLELLREVTDENCPAKQVLPLTSLPYDNPLPNLQFNGENYCITGQFALGPRKNVEHEIQLLGGNLIETPQKRRPNTLVVGYFTSRDWVHAAYGRKVEAAIAYRNKGYPVSIISEDHLMEQVIQILSPA